MVNWAYVTSTGVSVPERLSAELELMIVRGQLPPGERLPPERELAAELGVSRASLREALRELEIKGFLSRKPGRGTVIAPEAGRVSRDGSGLPWTGAAEHDLQQVMDLRAVVEPPMARRAAQRADAVDLDKLDALVKAASEPTSASEYLMLDVRFHHAIAEATHNPLLTQLLGTVNDWARTSRRLGLQGASRRRLSLEAHLRILDALRAGDGERAESEMSAHLDSVLRLVTDELHHHAAGRTGS